MTGTAFGTHDLAWLRDRARATATRCGSRTSPARWACFGLWGPRGPRRAAPRSPRGPVERRVPVPDHAGDDRRRRPGARAAGDLRRRARLGAVLPDGVRRGAVAHARRGRARRTGCVPAGYRAIESLRLEKGYRVWGSDVTRDTTPDEAGLGFCVRPGDGYAGAAALAAARRAGPARRLRCLVLADPRAVALGTSRCGSAAGDVPGSSRPAATATPSSGRSPTRCCRPRSAPAPRSRCRSTASGWPARSSGSRCTTRRGAPGARLTRRRRRGWSSAPDAARGVSRREREPPARARAVSRTDGRVAAQDGVRATTADRLQGVGGAVRAAGAGGVRGAGPSRSGWTACGCPTTTSPGGTRAGTRRSRWRS